MALYGMYIKPKHFQANVRVKSIKQYQIMSKLKARSSDSHIKKPSKVVEMLQKAVLGILRHQRKLNFSSCIRRTLYAHELTYHYFKLYLLGETRVLENNIVLGIGY